MHVLPAMYWRSTGRVDRQDAMRICALALIKPSSLLARGDLARAIVSPTPRERELKVGAQSQRSRRA